MLQGGEKDNGSLIRTEIIKILFIILKKEVCKWAIPTFLAYFPDFETWRSHNPTLGK
jgi:hypothetical protein